MDEALVATDAVFGVKESLIESIETVSDEGAAATYGVDAPFRVLEFDITLAAAPAPQHSPVHG